MLKQATITTMGPTMVLAMFFSGNQYCTKEPYLKHLNISYHNRSYLYVKSGD